MQERNALATRLRFAGSMEWFELSSSWMREESASWRLAMNTVCEKSAPKGLGLVVSLSASSLITSNERTLRREAAILQDALRQMAIATRNSVHTYILVDRLDLLYGWRSLAAAMPRRHLESPLGCFRQGESTSMLVHRALGKAVDLCRLPLFEGTSAPSNPAVLSAALEVRRLERGLSTLCDAVFFREDILIEGIFFGSTLPPHSEESSLSPLASALPTFVPLCEPAPRESNWFFNHLLKQKIPQAETFRQKQRYTGKPCSRKTPRLHPATLGMLFGTLALCWTMTMAFCEARRTLHWAGDKIRPPATVEELAAYRTFANAAGLRSRTGILPRFGMDHSRLLAAEAERRYAESYHDLKTVPGIEQVQEEALRAARSDDPVAKGNALLMLALVRNSLHGVLDPARRDTATQSALQALARSLDLATEDDLAQLDAYLSWSGRQDWMIETTDALGGFAAHLLVDCSEWLPDWLETLPTVRREAIPSLPDEHGGMPCVRPAWTLAGYAVVRDVTVGAHISDVPHPRRNQGSSPLDWYRRAALNAWLRAADEVDEKIATAIAAGDSAFQLRRAFDRDDPATHFSIMASAHLLPMFEKETGDAAFQISVPEVNWLRLWRRVNVTGKNFDAAAADTDTALVLSSRLDNLMRRIERVAESPEDLLNTVRKQFSPSHQAPNHNSGPDDLLGLAETVSVSLSRHINDAIGSPEWEPLSPRAAFERIRFLMTGLAAREIDEIWQKTVHAPYHLTAGGAAGRLARLWSRGGLLETFLIQAADGFWTWRGDEIDRAYWGGIAFPFSDQFLDFCNEVRRMGDELAAPEILMTMEVRAVNVTGTIREHPTAVEFLLSGTENDNKIVYRNYSIRQPVTLTRCADGTIDADASAIRLVFPSFTAVMEMGGKEGVHRFVSRLSQGRWVLHPEDFGDSAPALRRIGVDEIVIHSSMEGETPFLRYLERGPLVIPRSIISPLPGLSPVRYRNHGLQNLQAVR